MKIILRYPTITYTNRDPEVFDDIKMFDISFQTAIHYFKNYDTGYEDFTLLFFGFGLELSRICEPEK